jgi:hypothetical protein
LPRRQMGDRPNRSCQQLGQKDQTGRIRIRELPTPSCPLPVLRWGT